MSRRTEFLVSFLVGLSLGQSFRVIALALGWQQ